MPYFVSQKKSRCGFLVGSCEKRASSSCFFLVLSEFGLWAQHRRSLGGGLERLLLSLAEHFKFLLVVNLRRLAAAATLRANMTEFGCFFESYVVDFSFVDVHGFLISA